MHIIGVYMTIWNRLYNKVACGGQTSTTSYNIPENIRNVVSYNLCLVKKFDRHQTSYNKIQHNTTRYNKLAKRVQHFIQHQSCMMLYETLYSFGRGLTRYWWQLTPNSKNTVRPKTCPTLYRCCSTLKPDM